MLSLVTCLANSEEKAPGVAFGTFLAPFLNGDSRKAFQSILAAAAFLRALLTIVATTIISAARVKITARATITPTGAPVHCAGEPISTALSLVDGSSAATTAAARKLSKGLGYTSNFLVSKITATSAIFAATAAIIAQRC